MKKSVTLLLLNINMLMVLQVKSQTYTQMGATIYGSSAGDNLGVSVSLSADGQSFVTGSPFNDSSSNDAGKVSVFDWNGSSWVQRGSDIYGESADGQFGHSVSMSADGNTIAVGAPLNDGLVSDAGHVRVYTWNGSSWVQKGSDLLGENTDDEFGFSVSLSDNGDIIAIGAIFNSNYNTSSGQVKIYSWNGSSWDLLGNEILGFNSNENLGWSVSLSSDGSVLAVGSPKFSFGGQVQVFDWNGVEWQQVGYSIESNTSIGNLGWSVSLSSDGTVLAVGDINFITGDSGYVQIYDWDGTDWIQRGDDINGNNNYDLFGQSVSLSADGNTIGIGEMGNDKAYIYTWTGSTWELQYAPIEGTTFSYFGVAVSLSADGKTAAIGGYINSTTESEAGSVQAFSTSSQITLTGNEGWRLLSAGTTGQTYNSLISNLWTQGFTGADETGGASNVLTWTTNNATKDLSNWISISNQTENLISGNGFAMYVFSDDNGPNISGDSGFPKTISVSGFQPSENVSITINPNNSGWTLAGNPFNTTIDWDLIEKTNVNDAVYVYNTSTSSWISWNGSVGSLTNGLIQRFQGFFIQSANSGTPSLVIPTSAQLGSGVFYGKTAAIKPFCFSLKLTADGLSDHLWFSFTEDGNITLDHQDALKLTPLANKYVVLSSVLEDNTILDINNLPLLSEKTTIPLSFVTTFSNSFTISKDFFNLPDNWEITLFDSELGLSTDLNEPYIFEEVSVNKSAISDKSLPNILTLTNSSTTSTRFYLTINPSVLTNLEYEPSIGLNFKIKNAYPNPFNPVTTLHFTVSNTSTISFSVYDVLGRKMNHFSSLETNYSAGNYSLPLDFSSLPSGMYFIKAIGVELGTSFVSSQTVKVSLVK